MYLCFIYVAYAAQQSCVAYSSENKTTLPGAHPFTVLIGEHYINFKIIGSKIQAIF